MLAPLSEVEATDPGVVGVKAARLAAAMAAGFPVPDGFVVPVGDQVEDAELVTAAEVVAGRLAVRSSAVAEDLAGASFAGMYESYLDVPPAGVPDAVRRCRRSTGADRVTGYRGWDAEAGMAVLVQAMVAADAAGVAFTADPLTGARDVVLVTAVPGPAEDLVAGRTTGERWRVTGDRATRIGTGDVLTADQAAAVADTARRLQELFGSPQDVEWVIAGGRVQVVQARPMTALPDPVTWTPPGPGLWACNFRLGEWLPDPVTPLFADWLLPVFDAGFRDAMRDTAGAEVGRYVGEYPPAAVAYVARQVDVDPGELAGYEWFGSTAKYHRAQIPRALGFRRFSEDDEAKLAGWLADEVAPVETSDQVLREALLARCRSVRIEPPTRIDRILGAARAAVSDRFTSSVVARLSAGTVAGLEALAGLGVDGQDPASGAWLAELKADPGRVSRDTLRSEIAKLGRVRAIGLPDQLFEGWSDKLVAAWRARAAAEYPSNLRSHDQAVRLTLLAALAWTRQGEIVDGLVDLLIALVHKIASHAEQGAQAELVADLHRVRGKENLLFRLAEAALDHPDDTVRDALYPVAGPATLAELVREGRASESALRARTRARLRASYSSYYRKVIPELLDALRFRSSNTRHAPVIDAVSLMRRYAHRPSVRYYTAAETVPLDGIVPADWRPAVVEEREDGTSRVERIPYELCVLTALREAIRRREVWIVGAVRWRDPDVDLPADFDAHRAGHYERLGQPLDPSEFISSLQGELSAALSDLNAALTANDTGGVSIGARAGRPWITVPRLAKQPEPANLERIKAAVQARWGTVDLLDFLAEADHHIGLIDCFPSIATRETMPAATLRERLLLVLFALGTNTGIKHVADGDHGHSEAALRHVRRLFVTKQNLRRAIATLVNANYAARDPKLWGTGTACASDSKKFGSWESNLMTEWHARYRGPGVMIYWHVEKGRLCVYSQLKSCSSSEVAAMMEGLLHHGTDVPIEANYVDTHGASEIGFAFTHLLGYSLLPRLKNIGAARLYLPDAGLAASLPQLSTVLTRPIRWELIAQQYDQMVKYATALKLRTAESEQILRRFTRPGPQHPTYAALVELGRAVKSLFVARYLRSEPLRRQINDGLQVVENWNSANGALFYGKDRELTGADRDSQEISVLALHLLQSALVYVNTLLLQRILADQPIELSAEDRRAVSPLFWTHVRPYGTFQLHLDRHLDLEAHPVSA